LTQYLKYDYFFNFVITILLSVFLIIFSKKTTILLEHPLGRKDHAKPVPLIGGIVLFLMTLYVNSYNLNSINNFILYIVFIIGFIDDLIEIPYYVKLILQSLAGVFFVTAYHFIFTRNTFIDSFLTFFFFIAVLNAFNLIDGINGLLIGISIIYFAFTSNFLLLPILLALFILNITNNLFMGDSGAFLIAYLLISSNKIPLEFDKLVVFFGYPIYEITSSFMRRLIFSKNPFYPDKFHLHHIGTKKFGHTFFLILAFSLTAGFLLLSTKKLGLFIYIIISLLIFIFQINFIRNLNDFESVPERNDGNFEL